MSTILGGWMQFGPGSVLEGFIFWKVKVTGVKGQISISPRPLGLSRPNFSGWMELDQRSDHMRSIRSKVKVTGVKGQMSVSPRPLGQS